MRHDNHASRNGRIAMALVSGAAVGAAVGLLLAPTEGRRLRRQISDGAHRVGQETAHRYQDASRAVNGLVERSKGAITAGRQALQRARGKAGDPSDIA